MKNPVLKIEVSGRAGSGKSSMCHAIIEMLRTKYKINVTTYIGDIRAEWETEAALDWIAEQKLEVHVVERNWSDSE